MGKRAKQYAWMKDKQVKQNKQVSLTSNNHIPVEYEVQIEEMLHNNKSGIISFAIINCKPHDYLGGLKGAAKEGLFQCMTCDSVSGGNKECLFVILNASDAIVANYCNSYKLTSFIHCTVNVNNRTKLTTQYYTKNPNGSDILHSVGDALKNWSTKKTTLTFVDYQNYLDDKFTISGFIDNTNVKYTFDNKEWIDVEKRFLYAGIREAETQLLVNRNGRKPVINAAAAELSWAQGRVGLGAYAARVRAHYYMTSNWNYNENGK